MRKRQRTPEEGLTEEDEAVFVAKEEEVERRAFIKDKAWRQDKRPRQ